MVQTTANNTKTKVSDGLRSSHKSREHYEIVSDMLKAVQPGPYIIYNGEKKSLCKVHHISCRVSIPWSHGLKYLELMTMQNLMISYRMGNDVCYEISDKGFRYLPLFA